jgi:guanylate kinase
MKGKIFCLLGASATGKSTIESIIHNKGTMNKIVSSTTRPMRSNEKDNVDYHYISKDEFLSKLEKGDFIESTSYNVATGDTWYYGVDKTNLDLNKNYICVVNPRGYRQMRDVLGKDNVVGILVKVNVFKRLIHSFKRDSKAIVREIIRRLIADHKDFKGIEKEIDYIVKNRNIDKSVGLIINRIHEELG